MRRCSVVGCGRKHRAKGYCTRHYNQKRLYGEILKRTMYTPNKIIVKGAIAEIKHYNRKHKCIAISIIDSKYVKQVQKHKWCIKSPWHKYPHTDIGDKTISLHVFLFGKAPGKLEWDHKDRDPLNNRRNNLRFATRSQNIANSFNPNNTSGYRWIHWASNANKWRVRIKRINIGLFIDIADAIIARDEAAKEIYGEFVPDNC